MSPHRLIGGLPKDFLRPCALLLLYERPAHGYDLLERLGDFGFDSSDPGAVYRVLRKLEDDGLVSSSWGRSEHGGPRCRTYRLTDRGSAELDDRARQLADAARRVEGFLGRYLVARRGDEKRRAKQADTRRSSESGPAQPAPR